MTDEFYASYIEKKYRKRYTIANIIIIVIVLGPLSLLSYFFTPLWSLICIPYSFIHILFVNKKLLNYFYVVPINKILTHNADAKLFKNVFEQSLLYNPLSTLALLVASGEGDYQTIVNICNYRLKNTNEEKIKDFALVGLLQVYYELNDIEKLRVVIAEYKKLLQSTDIKPRNFLTFIEKYTDGDLENSSEYLDASIRSNPDLPFTKAKDNFHLGLLNYRRGNLEAARNNFAYICEKTPKLYYAKFAQSYIDAIDNGVDYNHAEEIGEIFPQEDFADSLNINRPSKKKIFLYRLKNIAILIVCLGFIIWTNVAYYFVSKPYHYPTAPIKIDVLFDCTTEDFFDKDLEIYDEIGDLRKCAEVVNGDIVFHFSRYQAYRLKNSEWLNAFRDSEKPDCVEISDNLKEIKVFITPEMKNYSKKEWATFAKQMNRIIFKIYLYQFVSNNFNEDDVISYKEIDGESGTFLQEMHISWDEKVSYENAYDCYHPYD